MLVRIRKKDLQQDPEHYDGPQEYDAGTYLTNYINVTKEEVEWMRVRTNEPSRVVKDVIEAWKTKEGHNKEMV